MVVVTQLKVPSWTKYLGCHCVTQQHPSNFFQLTSSYETVETSMSSKHMKLWLWVITQHGMVWATIATPLANVRCWYKRQYHLCMEQSSSETISTCGRNDNIPMTEWSNTPSLCTNHVNSTRPNVRTAWYLLYCVVMSYPANSYWSLRLNVVSLDFLPQIFRTSYRTHCSAEHKNMAL